MSGYADNPVYRVAQQRARRVNPFPLLTLSPLLFAGAFVWGAICLADDRPGLALGPFLALVTLALLWVQLLLTAARVHEPLLESYRTGVFGQLAVSGCTPEDWVRGGVAVQLHHGTVVLLAHLPLLVISWTLGGVTAGWLALATLAVLLSAAVLVCHIFIYWRSSVAVAWLASAVVILFQGPVQLIFTLLGGADFLEIPGLCFVTGATPVLAVAQLLDVPLPMAAVRAGIPVGPWLCGPVTVFFLVNGLWLLLLLGELRMGVPLCLLPRGPESGLLRVPVPGTARAMGRGKPESVSAFGAHDYAVRLLQENSRRGGSGVRHVLEHGWWRTALLALFLLGVLAVVQPLRLGNPCRPAHAELALLLTLAPMFVAAQLVGLGLLFPGALLLAPGPDRAAGRRIVRCRVGSALAQAALILGAVGLALFPPWQGGRATAAAPAGLLGLLVPCLGISLVLGFAVSLRSTDTRSAAERLVFALLAWNFAPPVLALAWKWTLPLAPGWLVPLNHLSPFMDFCRQTPQLEELWTGVYGATGDATGLGLMGLFILLLGGGFYACFKLRGRPRAAARMMPLVLLLTLGPAASVRAGDAGGAPSCPLAELRQLLALTAAAETALAEPGGAAAPQKPATPVQKLGQRLVGQRSLLFGLPLFCLGWAWVLGRLCRRRRSPPAAAGNTNAPLMIDQTRLEATGVDASRVIASCTSTGGQTPLGRYLGAGVLASLVGAAVVLAAGHWGEAQSSRCRIGAFGVDGRPVHALELRSQFAGHAQRLQLAVAGVTVLPVAPGVRVIAATDYVPATTVMIPAFSPVSLVSWYSAGRSTPTAAPQPPLHLNVVVGEETALLSGAPSTAGAVAGRLCRVFYRLTAADPVWRTLRFTDAAEPAAGHITEQRLMAPPASEATATNAAALTQLLPALGAELLPKALAFMVECWHENGVCRLRFRALALEVTLPAQRVLEYALLPNVTLTGAAGAEVSAELSCGAAVPPQPGETIDRATLSLDSHWDDRTRRQADAGAVCELELQYAPAAAWQPLRRFKFPALADMRSEDVVAELRRRPPGTYPPLAPCHEELTCEPLQPQLAPGTTTLKVRLRQAGDGPTLILTQCTLKIELHRR